MIKSLCYVSDAPVPSDQANIVHMMSICDAFQQNGLQTTLVLPLMDYSKTPEWFLQQYGVKNPFELRLLKLNFNRYARMPVFQSTALAIARKRGGIAYTRCHLFGWLASKWGLPTILELHVGFPLTHPLRQSAVVRACRHKSLKRIVCISEVLRQDIVESLRAAGVQTLPEIVVEHDGSPMPRAANPDFPWPYDRSKLQIGYVGHLYPGRGIERILQLAADFPEADVHIVGGRAQDQAHWKSQNVSPNIVFHGHVPYGVVPDYLSRFDIALAPYQKAILLEGGKNDISRWISPLKLFDYMAYGLPIVTSNIPTIAEVLRHEQTALLCDPDDYGAWRGAVARLASDPALRARLGGAAKHELVNTYAWTKRAERLVAGIAA